MTLRTLLVDDEAPARDRMRRLLGAHADVEIVGDAGDGRVALEKIAELEPSLVLLDIQMPELDGLRVAESIADDGPSVVFVTAFDQHALRAFELAAVDYLTKPVDKARLAEALDRVRKRRAPPATQQARAVLSHMPAAPRRMAVRTGAKYVVFDCDRIAAIVAQDHYAAIYVDGKELLADDPLDKLMPRLDDSKFMRVHRGAILNLDFVTELHQEGDRKFVAALRDFPDVRVPISRERLDDVKSRLGVG